MSKVTKLKIGMGKSSIQKEGFQIDIGYYLRHDDRFDNSELHTDDEATAIAVINVLELAKAKADDGAIITAAMKLGGMGIRIDQIDSNPIEPLKDGDVVTWLGDVLGDEESDYSSFGLVQSYSVWWHDGKGKRHDVELVTDEEASA